MYSVWSTQDSVLYLPVLDVEYFYSFTEFQSVLFCVALKHLTSSDLCLFINCTKRMCLGMWCSLVHSFTCSLVHFIQEKQALVVDVSVPSCSEFPCEFDVLLVTTDQYWPLMDIQLLVIIILHSPLVNLISWILITDCVKTPLAWFSWFNLMFIDNHLYNVSVLSEGFEFDWLK